MLEFLAANLPRDVITLIYIFEGRITRAYLREYISSVYSSVFQTYFGRNHNLKYICGSNDPRFDQMGALPFYSAWTSLILKKYPHFRKVRKSRKYMREYHGLIKDYLLRTHRLRLEKSVRTNYDPRLNSLRFVRVGNDGLPSV